MEISLYISPYHTSMFGLLFLLCLSVFSSINIGVLIRSSLLNYVEKGVLSGGGGDVEHVTLLKVGLWE